MDTQQIRQSPLLPQTEFHPTIPTQSQLTLTSLADLLEESETKTKLVKGFNKAVKNPLIPLVVAMIPDKNYATLRLGVARVFRVCASHPDVCLALDEVSE